MVMSVEVCSSGQTGQGRMEHACSFRGTGFL